MAELVTLEKVKKNREIRALIDAANRNLENMGYTEHGVRHVGYVSKTTANILKELGYDDRTVEVGAITGWIHDIGNAINRKHHGLSGATLAFSLLTRMRMDMEEIATVIGAVGNHEEETGVPVSAVSAALIIADKSDAHRSRVRKNNFDYGDIHDRVNMSIKKNYLAVDKEKHKIRLVIIMDESSALMEYLQIYLSRMILSEKAAGFLGYTFELVINGAVINRQSHVSSITLKPTETEVSED
ncbi:MAG: phosphohydrolase [Clostridiales bacterium]|nr:phosphohydrolase [Clostridiales bacterium]